jgi:hypothetical protein
MLAVTGGRPAPGTPQAWLPRWRGRPGAALPGPPPGPGALVRQSLTVERDGRVLSQCVVTEAEGPAGQRAESERGQRWYAGAVPHPRRVMVRGSHAAVPEVILVARFRNSGRGTTSGTVGGGFLGAWEWAGGLFHFQGCGTVTCSPARRKPSRACSAASRAVPASRRRPGFRAFLPYAAAGRP